MKRGKNHKFCSFKKYILYGSGHTFTAYFTKSNTQPTIRKWVASFKSSLLLNNYLQRIQIIQLNEIGNYLQK